MLMLTGDTGDGDKVWEIGKNLLKQIQHMSVWILLPESCVQ